jgi:hypothetical protein
LICESLSLGVVPVIGGAVATPLCVATHKEKYMTDTIFGNRLEAGREAQRTPSDHKDRLIESSCLVVASKIDVIRQLLSDINVELARLQRRTS